MYTLLETDSEFSDLDGRAKSFVADICGQVQPSEEGAVIPAGTDVSGLLRGSGDLLLLKDGSLSYALQEKVLFYYNEGDLIGFEHLLLPASPVITSEFAVIADRYRAQDISDACLRDQKLGLILNSFFQTQFQLLTRIIRHLLRSDVILSPEVRHFSAGETIIQQGTQAEEVYTLVEGRAEAFVDEVKVGEILRDEIFGMLAAVTGTPRTATVRASSNCMILAIPKERFLDLINNRPQTVLKLLEDMSRLIVDLNSRVVGFRLSAL